MNLDLSRKIDFWSAIESSSRPIVIYGTGNGAEKLTYMLEERGRKVSAYFASDGFVRDRSFMGLKVRSFASVKEEFGDEMVVLGAFGSHFRDVIEYIKRISEDCEFYFPDIMTDESGQPFTFMTLEADRERIERIYDRLADEESKRVFRNNILFRLTGKLSYILSDMNERGDNWSLLDIPSSRSFLDCGAYDGDTVRLYRSLGGRGKAIAMEPDEKTFRKLSRYAETDPLCFPRNAALQSECGMIMFDSGSGRGSHKGRSREMEAVTIDSIVGDDGIDIIKMDIEGEEEHALGGAHETISRFRPRICISAYHKVDDYWRLPEVIDGIRDDYTYYMRRTISIPCWDTEFFLV